MAKIRLSKSRLMKGYQCPKSLYLATHLPEQAAPPSPSQQALFDQGHLVGIEAQSRFPGGVLIDALHTQSTQAIEETQAAINQGTNTLYEATFIHEGVLVKVDILHRKSSKDPWHIIEVKSSTSVKDEYLQDTAIQKWVLEGAGLKISKAYLMHINNQCVYPDLASLFNQADITAEVNELIPGIPEAVARFQKILENSSAPDIDIGPQCDAPYECAHKAYCWGPKNISSPSVFDLPKLATEKKWDLYRKGLISLDQLQGLKLTEAQSRMIESTVKNERYVDPATIRAELSSWEFPLYFFDFETIAWAIPKYEDTRPYQQIPFQFSCHIQLEPGGPLLHQEYLHDEESDPRPPLTLKLLEALGSHGSIVAYNKGFEGRCLSELAMRFAKHRSRLQALIERLVDPLPLIRTAVYDPQFRGSFSIKAVAPALLGESMSYEAMSVGSGTDAQSAYLQLIGPKLDPARKAELKQHLIHYCEKDTLALVGLVEWLRNVSLGQAGE